MPNSPSSSNQNVNHIYQAIQTLGDTLNAKIDTVLQGFDARLLRLEGRVDKMEELQRAGTQWANDVHADMMRTLTDSMQQSERRILDKLEASATELKSTEIRLNNKIEERDGNRRGRLLAIVLTGGGWVLALLQFALSYLHPR